MYQIISRYALLHLKILYQENSELPSFEQIEVWSIFTKQNLIYQSIKV